MLVTIAVLLITVVSLLATRYLILKTKLTEQSIDDAILRRMRTSPAMSEMSNLREMNGVMRNILADLVENEELGSRTGDNRLTPAEKKRLLTLRETRRREIYAESLVLLRHVKPPAKPLQVRKTAD